MIKILPTSYSQKGFLLLDQLLIDKKAYSVPFKLVIDKNFCLHKFEKSIKCLMLRHEILRTSFFQENGKFYQKIHEDVDFHLNIINLTAVDEAVKLKFDNFDLTKAPLMACWVFKFPDQHYEIYFDFHHIIVDFWSLSIIFKELEACYKAFSEGKKPELVNDIKQYADFSVYEARQFAVDNVNDEIVQFWKKQFITKPVLLELPFEKSRAIVSRNHGASLRFEIEKKIILEVKSLGEKYHISIAMFLFSIFQLLIFRYTQQEDITIGMPMANRQNACFLNTAGPISNTLPIRQVLDGGMTALSLLKATRDVLLDAFTYQEMPYAKLVEEVNSLFDDDYLVLFNVFFNFTETNSFLVELPGVEMHTEEIFLGYSKFDLSLYIQNNHDGLACNFEYNAELFSKETILRLSNHFKNLLCSVINNLQGKLSKLSMLSEDELIVMLG